MLVFLATLATIAQPEPYQFAEQAADDSFTVIRFATRQACEQAVRPRQAAFDQLPSVDPARGDPARGTRWVVRPVCMPLASW